MVFVSEEKIREKLREEKRIDKEKECEFISRGGGELGGIEREKEEE